MHKLVIMDSSGDTVLEWNPADTKSVEQVKEEFDRIVASGSLAYTPTREAPGRHDQIREFDPTAEEIVLRAPLVGG